MTVSNTRPSLIPADYTGAHPAHNGRYRVEVRAVLATDAPYLITEHGTGRMVVTHVSASYGLVDDVWALESIGIHGRHVRADGTIGQAPRFRSVDTGRDEGWEERVPYAIVSWAARMNPGRFAPPPAGTY